MKLEVKNITKTFGEKEVLKGISFSVESGKALGLLGRNGAGKTTTIRILMDVFRANQGEVLLDGEKFDIRRVQIGYLPEERGLYIRKERFLSRWCIWQDLGDLIRRRRRTMPENG